MYSPCRTAWFRPAGYSAQIFDEGTEDDDDERDPLEAEVCTDVAREHTLTIMESEICEYCQWFEGVSNVVADTLSRDDD